MSKQWTTKEIGHLRMILDNYQDTIYAMAGRAHEKLRHRSVTSIAHKIREILSQREFTDDHVTLDGQDFPAKVVSGYIIIKIDEKECPAHIWLWERHYGEVPQGFHVHHINGIRTDNRIENLALLEAGEHIRLHMASKPPETFTLFCFLQEEGLWEKYLSYRKDAIDLIESLGTKKP